MGREKLDYRNNLERIIEVYPNKDVLTIKEVEAYTRKERRALFRDKSFPAKKIGGTYAITIAALARYLSV